MPSVPIVMPSEMAIVLNSIGVPPAARTPSFTVVGERAQVQVARHRLGPRVGDADERLLEVGVGEAGGLEHRACGRSARALLQLIASHGFFGFLVGKTKDPATREGVRGQWS